MGVEINWWAVLAAAAASMILGFLWYAPPIYGNTWMRAAGVSPKKTQKGMAGPTALAIAMSLLTAYVVAHMSFLANQYFEDSFFVDAVQTSFWLWFGVSAATLVTHYSFEGRPAKLVWLNIGNRFMTIIAMGMVIGWLHP